MRPETRVTKVDFVIDGTSKSTDQVAPYQFGGDPAGRLDTTSLTNGQHRLAVTAYGTGGLTVTASSSVTVSNAATPPPAPSYGSIPRFGIAHRLQDPGPELRRPELRARPDQGGRSEARPLRLAARQPVEGRRGRQRCPLPRHGADSRPVRHHGADQPEHGCGVRLESGGEVEGAGQALRIRERARPARLERDELREGVDRGLRRDQGGRPEGDRDRRRSLEGSRRAGQVRHRHVQRRRERTLRHPVAAPLRRSVRLRHLEHLEHGVPHDAVRSVGDGRARRLSRSRSAPPRPVARRPSTARVGRRPSSTTTSTRSPTIRGSPSSASTR